MSEEKKLSGRLLRVFDVIPPRRAQEQSFLCEITTATAWWQHSDRDILFIFPEVVGNVQGLGGIQS